MIETMQRFQHTVSLFHHLGGARRVLRGPSRCEARLPALAPVEEHVLSRCGSGVTLGEILDESSYDEIDTLEAIRRLIDLGLLECA